MNFIIFMKLLELPILSISANISYNEPCRIFEKDFPMETGVVMRPSIGRCDYRFGAVIDRVMSLPLAEIDLE